MKHVLLRNSRLKGWEYGVLRALEETIIAQTDATVIEVPDYGAQPLLRRAVHGMRLDSLRPMLPKKKLPVEADVIWYILMCPENYELDLFTGWEHVPKRLVYIFDTLVPHFPIIKNLFSGDAFNVLISSFHDAAEHLTRLTGKHWNAIEQAVPADRFNLVEKEEKLIHFSSYGRRHARFHDCLLEFCRQQDLYYDYSTHNAPNVWIHEEELYRHYAWHLQHSFFTVSWPVEITNPLRAGYFNPITCRWFEAAACGTVVIGQAPDNVLFDKLLHPDLVVKIDPEAPKNEIFKKLGHLWANRQQYQQAAYAIGMEQGDNLTWKNRVNRMLALL